MSGRTLSILVILVFLALLVGRSLFTVSESELAIRTAFGKVTGTGYAPGLHLKWPVDNVEKFDRRILSQSYTGETFLTNDNRALIVDFYVKWRVKDAPTYFNATEGHEDQAGARIAEIVKDGIKSVMAQRTLEQIVSAERAAVTSQMFGQASEHVSVLGVQLIDVRVQRIDLPEEVAAQVYESMKENFRKIASRLRAEGQKQAATIRANAERQRLEILSAAQGDALRVRGESDAQAARIYAQAYSKNPEFYAFYRALQAYRSSLGKDGDILVLSPDGEFFKYLKEPDRAAPSLMKEPDHTAPLTPDHAPAPR
jgi:membrane protease subunit HflC